MSFDSTRESDSRLRAWFLLFLLAGISLRVFRYFVDMAVWGDEASLALNILNRGYQGLRQPLDNVQVAPIGFLWSQRWMYVHFGMSEWSMRFLPMLAGLGALLMFAWWVRLLAGPLAATFAIGIMAVGNYCIRYGVELKPYGYDLQAAMLLLLPATLFLLRRQTQWLICLLILTPLALVMSYPTLFIAGGVGVALILKLRQMRPLQIVLGAIWALEMLAIFWFVDWHVGQSQYNFTQVGMVTYWKAAFPPANPLKFIWWLILIHTGNMFEYPGGGANGGSTASFLLFLFGLALWLRKRQWSLICLLFVPFALNFVAAVVRKYPYGASARVAQPLAPAIILMIAIGIEALIQRFVARPSRRLLARRLVFAGLLIFGALGVGDMIIHPYKTPDDAQARTLIRNLFRRAGPHDVIAVLMPRDQVRVTLQWYLREQNSRIIWNAAAHHSWQNSPQPIWVVNMEESPGIQQRLEIELHRPGTLVQRYVATHDFQTIPIRYWELFSFPSRVVRSAGAAGHGQAGSS